MSGFEKPNMPHSSLRKPLTAIFSETRRRFNSIALFRERFALFSLFGFVLSYFGIIFLLIWQVPLLPPQVPFFYTLLGENRLADKNVLWAIPVILLILFFINFILARLNYKREPAISHTLLVTLFAVSFIALLGIIKVISLVL